MGRKAKRGKILKRRMKILGEEIDPKVGRRCGLGHIIDEQLKAKRIAELRELARIGEEERLKKAKAKKAAEAKRKKEERARLKLEKENQKALEVVKKTKPKKRTRRTTKASK